MTLLSRLPVFAAVFLLLLAPGPGLLAQESETETDGDPDLVGYAVALQTLIADLESKAEDTGLSEDEERYLAEFRSLAAWAKGTWAHYQMASAPEEEDKDEAPAIPEVEGSEEAKAARIKALTPRENEDQAAVIKRVKALCEKLEAAVTDGTASAEETELYLLLLADVGRLEAEAFMAGEADAGEGPGADLYQAMQLRRQLLIPRAGEDKQAFARRITAERDRLAAKYDADECTPVEVELYFMLAVDMLDAVIAVEAEKCNKLQAEFEKAVAEVEAAIARGEDVVLPAWLGQVRAPNGVDYGAAMGSLEKVSNQIMGNIGSAAAPPPGWAWNAGEQGYRYNR